MIQRSEHDYPDFLVCQADRWLQLLELLLNRLDIVDLDLPLWFECLVHHVFLGVQFSSRLLPFEDLLEDGSDLDDDASLSVLFFFRRDSILQLAEIAEVSNSFRMGDSISWQHGLRKRHRICGLRGLCCLPLQSLGIIVLLATLAKQRI